MEQKEPYKPTEEEMVKVEGTMTKEQVESSKYRSEGYEVGQLRALGIERLSQVMLIKIMNNSYLRDKIDNPQEETAVKKGALDILPEIEQRVKLPKDKQLLFKLSIWAGQASSMSDEELIKTTQLEAVKELFGYDDLEKVLEIVKKRGEFRGCTTPEEVEKKVQEKAEELLTRKLPEAYIEFKIVGNDINMKDAGEYAKDITNCKIFFDRINQKYKYSEKWKGGASREEFIRYIVEELNKKAEKMSK